MCVLKYATVDYLLLYLCPNKYILWSKYFSWERNVAPMFCSLVLLCCIGRTCFRGHFVQPSSTGVSASVPQHDVAPDKSDSEGLLQQQIPHNYYRFCIQGHSPAAKLIIKLLTWWLEKTGSSGTFINIYHTTWHHIPEDSNLQVLSFIHITGIHKVCTHGI
jgi:hypothetical protein